MRRSIPLRIYLLLLLLVAVIPTILVIGFAVWQSANTLRTASSQLLHDSTRAMAIAVEGELQSSRDLLRTLAATDRQDGGASGVLTSYNSLSDGRSGQVTEISGNQLRSLEGGRHDPHIAIPLNTLKQAAQLRQAMVSNLFSLPQSNAYRIAIVTPAPTREDADRLIALLISPDWLIQAIQKQDTGLDHILVAVTDSEGQIVARSREPDRFVGQHAPDWDKLISIKSRQGQFRAQTTEGNPIVFSFRRLNIADGWAVVVGEPQGQFDARWRNPLISLVIAGIASLLIALFASFLIARLVLRPVRALVDRSKRVVSDEDMPDPLALRSSIREFEELRHGLENAEIALRRRADAEREAARKLADREKRYRALAEVGALVFWRRARSGEMLAADGWGDLTGEKDANPLGNGWMRDICPDDRTLVVTSWNEVVSTGGNLDVEFRIMSASRNWHWVRARGAPVRDSNDEIIEWIGVLEDVNERRQAQARITHMAHHDALTDLPNRVLFAEKLSEVVVASRYGNQGAAILCIDLDRFKDVNDTLGHAAGDQLLKAVTRRLKANVKSNDVIARLGGDEFVVLQAAGDQPVAASALAGRIIEKLSEPYDLNGNRAVIGASIGITLIDNAEDGPDLVMQRGDMALYRAKEEGRQQFAFFEPGMDARMQARRQKELELRRGLAAGEFGLVYQPFFESDERVLVGFEALLRWNHPNGEVQSPAEFLPLAEELGLIVPLGRTLLWQACMEAVNWPQHLRIAVNISPVQLSKPGFADMVIRCLVETGLMPDRLELEIPEEALMRYPTQALQSLGILKREGVRIVMDHFGTGTSSIGHLRTFPFDKVKIDSSFIQSLGTVRESDAIVSAITGLCRTIGIAVAALGVETENQLEILVGHTRLELQGYFLGRPDGADTIISYIENLSSVQKHEGHD